jgi:DNA-binding transcriptional MocR family regulator
VAACLLNPTFQNPLGFDMPAERKEQLVKLFRKREIPTIEDDIFGELYFGTGMVKIDNERSRNVCDRTA